MTRSTTATLIAALRILARDIEADRSAFAEAADRLEEMLRDVATVLPAISSAAGRLRTEAGREFRYAADRLAAEVRA